MFVSLQVDVLTKDAERLAGENNELHLRLIQQAEKAESSMREHVKKRKNMEDSVAELTFCKTTLSTKSATLEKENAALQAKLQEVLKDLEACHQAVSDGELLEALKKPVTVSLHDESGDIGLQWKLWHIAYADKSLKLQVRICQRGLCTLMPQSLCSRASLRHSSSQGAASQQTMWTSSSRCRNA